MKGLPRHAIVFVALIYFSVFPRLLLAADNAGMALHQIAENVYAIVGSLGQRDSQNYGNNATFGFVVTDEGVMLIDSGATLKGAQAIEAMIRTVTDKPIRIVINSGGQDHRWLGNAYFHQLGAKLIASEAAVADQSERVPGQLERLNQLVGEAGVVGTIPRHAAQTVEVEHGFDFGGERIQLFVVGPAHTPGDMLIWLP